jgi:hypothetical protein
MRTLLTRLVNLARGLTVDDIVKTATITVAVLYILIVFGWMFVQGVLMYLDQYYFPGALISG